jgi:hypothetical protein
MTINEAIKQCRSTSLSGWALVEYAQRLVSSNMTYSYSNSLDSPEKAFEKGRGYCWHQASALNKILVSLGIESRLVHAARNLVPAKEFEGVSIPERVSGHVWCRVTIDGVEKDVCPGHKDNRPGLLYNFKPLSSVKEWGPVIAFFSYWGSAMVNAQRRRKINMKKKQIKQKWNPETCPCKKKEKCPRYKKCDECKQHHYSRNSLPYCER